PPEARAVSTNGHSAVTAKEIAQETRARAEAVQDFSTVPGIVGVATAMRKTVDSLGVYFGNTPVIVPPPDFEHEWEVFNLGANTFARMTPQALVSRMIELSPDIS